jgi:alginate O-acetyltransferase complex protein AlgI
MVFSSILFLCIFLPATVLLYYVLPRRLRNLALLLVSLVFYAWGEPRYVVIMLFTMLFDYGSGLLLERLQCEKGRQKTVLIITLVVNLGMLCFFKYTDFTIENLNRLLGTDLGLLRLALPIGISFYTFQALSYTIDVYRGTVKAQHNLIDFSMYISLFPQLIAGPIVRYSDIEMQLRDRRETSDQVWHGVQRFAVGLGKKVLLANQIGGLWKEISATGGKIPAGTAWLGALAFTFQIYFDFSGYSDMAIGLGELFGFQFPENFKYPYMAASITEFWRRWHITLSTWFREYLYIPLGGNRCGKRRQVFNLLVVWCLTGLWHGAGWNFLLWGLFYFLLLTAEKLFLSHAMEHWPKILRHVYALFFIVIGWVIFACDDMHLLGSYFGSLFGAHGAANEMTLYYLGTYGVLLLILILAATKLPLCAAVKIKQKLLIGEKTCFVLSCCFVVLLLAASIALLVGDSYNPFLYFRF